MSNGRATRSLRRLVSRLTLVSLGLNCAGWIGTLQASDQLPPAGVAVESNAKVVLSYKTLVPDPLSQRYQVELFENGQVIYTGIGNVRSKGQHRLYTTPDNVRTLVDAIWRRPEPLGGSANLGERRRVDRTSPKPIDSNLHDVDLSLPTWQLTVVRQGETRMFVRWLPDPFFDKWLRSQLDIFASTKQWRCPFEAEERIVMSPRRVWSKGADICLLQEEQDAAIALQSESK